MTQFLNVFLNSTLVDILRYRATHQPNNCAFIFLQDGETQAVNLTYKELDRQARAIAFHLQSVNAVGSRVLLLYPPGLEFIAAFLGCLYAKVIAVPAYPPRRNQKINRLQAIVKDAEATLCLTTASELDNIRNKFIQDSQLAGLECLATDSLGKDGSDWQKPVIDKQTLAFLQYTSGSTGKPKGVMVSHDNLIHNSNYIQQAFELTKESVSVTWLPSFHDMGLVDGILQPLYTGFLGVVMSPTSFLGKPVRWLQAISDYKATHCGGPNFAYELCINKITSEQIQNIDLSSWCSAYNGAEPVRQETLMRFVEKFQICGFRESSFYPCYGMAETTLMVSGGSVNDKPTYCSIATDSLLKNRVAQVPEGSKGLKKIVGCGHEKLDTKIAIVNPETFASCVNNEVGEIWVSSDSVAQGYWNKPELTEKTFQAYLSNTNKGPFLRTGDLGFLKDGELFVTGRIKDVIIIRGRNHYPQDIELTVEKSHPALRVTCGAAFTVEVDGKERLVIAQEVERVYLRKLKVDEVVGAIRKAVSEQHQLQVDGVLLLKTGSIPKTSSGKIQRHACRKNWLDKQLNLVGEWTVKDLVELRNIEHPADESLPIHNNGNQKLASQDKSSQRSADELLEWLRSYSCERINSRLIDERRCIPPHIVLDFGNRGLFGLQVAPKYGGLGLNNVDTLRVIEQLGAIDQTLTLFVGNHNVLGVGPIMKYGSPAQKEQLLPKLATGREIAAYALTEPGAGSNPRAISTKAVPNGNGGWLLEGYKIWSGSAAWSSVINVFAQQLDSNGESMGISCFVVPQRTKGLRQGPEALTLGMRGMVQNSIFLEGVSVREQQLLGEAGTGMKVAQDAMMYGRLGLAAGCIGGMKRCAQLMLRYSQRRSVSTGCLLNNPVTLVRLSNLTAAITAVESLVFTIAQLLDKEYLIPEEVYTACKTSAPEFFWQAADHLVQLLGGRGYIETNIAPQILRDARVFRIFEGPTETLNMFLGSRVIQKGEQLEQFLSETLAVPEVAELLNNAKRKIRDRITNNSRFSENHTALRWVYVCTGELATWAILLAAVKANITRINSEPLQIATTWVSLQFEQKLQLILMGIPGEMVLSESKKITDCIVNYAEKIGDLEQTLPVEDNALDEFLRKTSIENHRKNSDIELNKYQNRTDVVIEHKNYQQKENIANWIEQWLAKQPDIEVVAITHQASFADYGMDSVLAVELVQALEDWLETSLNVTILWNFTTIESLAQYLASKNQTKKKANNTSIKSKPEEPTKTEIETSVTEELAALEKLLQEVD